MLTADVAKARAFLARLAPEADRFTLQTFDDTAAKRPAAARVHQVDPSNGALDELAKWNARGAGIFVTVNETDGTGRQTHNIRCVRAVFVDLDGAPLGPVLSAPLEPHIVVESSPGRYHAYWLCDDCPLDQFERVQRALAVRFGGDPSVHDLPRVMRLPGFVHNKGEPFLAHELEGIGFNGPPYELADIVAALALDLSPVAAHKAAPVRGDGMVQPGERHSHLFAIGRSMAKRGMTRDAVWAALDAENRTHCDPPIADAEVCNLANRAFTAKDAASWDAQDRATRSVAYRGAPEVHAEAANAAAADSSVPWPTLDPAARYGVAGELLAAIEPETEADPAAVLMQLLVAFGVYAGRNCYVPVEGDRHYSNLFVIIVGDSSAARKGTSFGRVRQVFDELPAPMPQASGLTSGEGLKFAVRDASGTEGEKGADPGASDKRLLVVESEFAQVLKACERNGQTLSAAVRGFWDTGSAQTLTKNEAVKVTDAHVGIIGHITPDELRAELRASERANGFGNRFLYVCAKRSRLLPFGGDKVELSALRERLLRAAILSREQTGPRQMDAEARGNWQREYERLTTRPPSLYGSITGRAAPQCLRLALCYALLDESPMIRSAHLRAAFALWRYCEDSARHIFGCALGDSVADEIVTALRAAGSEGMTRTDIRDLFKRHATSDRIGVALDLLRSRGLAHFSQTLTGGRPSEVWRIGAAT